MSTADLVQQMANEWVRFEEFLEHFPHPDREHLAESIRQVTAVWAYLRVAVGCYPPVLEVVDTLRGPQIDVSWSITPNHVLIEFRKDGSYEWLAVFGGEKIESLHGEAEVGVDGELVRVMHRFNRLHFQKRAEAAKWKNARPIFTSGTLS